MYLRKIKIRLVKSRSILRFFVHNYLQKTIYFMWLNWCLVPRCADGWLPYQFYPFVIF